MPDLYSLIGVESDVSPEDLRKAYKRAALRCHPDRKGGSVEDFQNLQRAYAILNDPYQRKVLCDVSFTHLILNDCLPFNSCWHDVKLMPLHWQLYDTYGEEMLQIMEGNGGPDMAARVFARISMYQRAQLVIFFFVATSLLMLTPIFIVLRYALYISSLQCLTDTPLVRCRWDLIVHWQWIMCFIPLWVLHAMACVPVVMMPSPPEDMSSEEAMEWHAAMHTQRAYRAAAVVVMSLLIILEVLVALRLDESISWSWHAVLVPWALLEFIGIVRKLALAGTDGSDSGLPPVGWNLVRLAMAFTVAAKLDGTIDHWDTAFTPYFIAIAISFILLLRQCYATERGVDGQSPQQLACTGMCSLFILALWIGLVLWHLDEPDEVSALVVMLPLFIPPYLLCCCLSCYVCLLGESDIADAADDSGSEFRDTSTVPLNSDRV